LPLLVAFFWLAWQGSQEFKKLQAYQIWAEQFERAKYDIYAVLAQKGDDITWGKPTSTEPLEIQSLSLDDVTQIYLLVDDRLADLNHPPTKGSPSLAFDLVHRPTPIKIPFTEIPMAIQWVQYLQKIKAGLSSVE
jgi:hypothetical protein